VWRIDIESGTRYRHGRNLVMVARYQSLGAFIPVQSRDFSE
jgi:hypothetical protein